MALAKIVIKGARQNNLKNLELEIPRNKFIVITGVSGSGKSSLAMETIYAEGQRRYVESLSVYARQFLERMDKPDVDFMEGLSPAIAIEQKNVIRHPRSTVGTITEIYDYLRLLFARIGQPYCYKCGEIIKRRTVDEIVDAVMKFPSGTAIQVLAPITLGQGRNLSRYFQTLKRQGFLRVQVDGKIYSLDEEIRINEKKVKQVAVVVDRLVSKPEIRTRLADSVQTALGLGEGWVCLLIGEDQELVFSEKLACTKCGTTMGELTPQMFSFSSPLGMCPDCTGLGDRFEFDVSLIIPDPEKSIKEGAIHPWSGSSFEYYLDDLKELAREYGFSINTPFKDLKPEHQRLILHGDGYFEGVIPNLQRRYEDRRRYKEIKYFIRRYMRLVTCPTCEGKRLLPSSLAVKVGEKSIAEVCEMSIDKAAKFFENLTLTDFQQKIASEIIKEIRNRLNFLLDIGLYYLTLGLPTRYLSGGETQRVHLATQIGSQLVGVLYVLDEPSIGLHSRDNQRLINTFLRLRNQGNTVVVIEHDEDTICQADFVIDLGPGAGENGGKVIYAGSPDGLIYSRESLTGRYLRHEEEIPWPERRRRIKGKYITVLNAQHNNLKNIDAKIPLEVFTCITGVSGSGKSSLINDILYRALVRKFYSSNLFPGKHRVILGWEKIDKVILIDQSPIGKTPRSNPITYIGGFTPIRELFARLPESKTRGYKAGRFSFNVPGGRCEACQGNGLVRLEMYFLPDVYVKCQECNGKRFNRQTLEVKYKGKNIADVLEMTVEEAVEFFQNIPQIRQKLKILEEVGLGYLRLGQPAPSLSGGEAQRIKLAAELVKIPTGRTLYLLDEPTTGLHFDDVKKLLAVLHRLTDAGNTVVVIEHNLEVIKTADWIIDLGPEGGDTGGRIVAEGTPEEIMRVPHSYTGQALVRLARRSRKEKILQL